MDIERLIAIAIHGSLFLLGLSVGFSAPHEALGYLLRRPSLLARSFAAMNIVMPLAAILVAVAFSLHVAVELALLTMALSPLPVHFHGRVAKAQGDADYALSLMDAMAVLSVVVVPAWVWLIGSVLGTPLGVPAASVLRVVGGDILVPILAGALVHRVWPDVARRLAHPCERISVIVLVIAVIPICVRVLPELLELLGNKTLIAIAAFAALGLAVGHVLGGPARGERVVLAIATASRHPGVVIAIARATVPHQARVRAAVLLYIVTSGVLVAIYARRQRAVGPSSESSSRMAA
jgi:BASS family bile acid:Na+ symporter